ncbi:MAG TPA: hypothetical protein VFD27_01760 [Chthoniobacteraceae bacterium]|jgi:hypothetical protein|nr:hypothetical protein [Chthoniobacteraceae bacterium]
MIQDSDDRQLRALFHEQLGNDATDAPDFARVWAAAARRRQTRVRVLRILPFAAALSVGAALSLFPHAPVKPPTRVVIQLPTFDSRDLPWRSAILLTEWRAPSDAIFPTELQP